MGKPTPLRSVVRSVMKETEASYPDNTHKLWELWPEAVGPELAKRCAPLSLRSGRLTVAVESPVWLQQLTLLSATVIENVNDLLGGEVVKKAVFKQATVNPPEVVPEEGLPEGWEKIPLTPEEELKVEAACLSLEDGELRQSVERAISTSIRRSKVRRS